MATEYDNNMKGVLFKSKLKRKETDSDMYGTITIDNIEYKISAWNKNSDKVGDYLKISVYKAETNTPDGVPM